MQDTIKEILAAYEPDRRYALAMLQDMQRAFNYVPREGLEGIALYLGCPVSQLYAMATFYKALSLKPKGRHIIKLCNGTACHLRGAMNLAAAVQRELGIGPGDVTEDGEFSLELVNCLGSCALAPILVVDEEIFGNVNMEKAQQILRGYQDGAGEDASDQSAAGKEVQNG